MRTGRRKWLATTMLVGLIGVLPVVTATAAAEVADDDSVFISEIHYDNDGTDEGEAVEIFGPTGTDLTGWTLVRYNGSNGSVYGTSPLSGLAFLNPVDGFGVLVVSFPVNGLQNGAPDGVALVDGGGTVRHFLSYEGSFTAVGGAADGLVSTDIGVSEGSTTPVGSSLQLSGTGSCYTDLTWQSEAPNTFGAVAPITPVVGADCSGGGGGGGGGDVPPVRLSELHYDNTGGDLNEGIEIFGPALTDLTGWSVELYNGSNGALYGTIALSGSIDDEGAGSGAVAFARSGIQNGAPDGLALIDSAGVVIEFASYEGAFMATSGTASGMTSTDIGVAETGSTAANQSLQRDAAGTWGGPFCASFGDINETDPLDSCPEPKFIHEVQGSGDTSPIVGARVIIEGVVVGDHEGPSPALRGFFVQEEDADADADPLTSEGIFVFNFNNDDVNLGDLVRVEGTVVEFRTNSSDTRTITELTDFVVVEVLPVEGPAPVVTPAIIEFPLSAIDDLEAYEGMVGSFAQELVISEYFNYDRFGEVVVALPAPGEDRPFNPTAVFDPESPEAAARADLNLLSRITVDDGITSQNPDAPIHPITRDLFSLDNSFRGGDSVVGLTGPIHYGFGLYRILPYVDGGFDTYTRTSRPGAPDPVGGDLTVATLNALNYFVSLDIGPNSCGPGQDQGCRGADNAEEFERQRVKLLNAIEGLDADVVGLVEIENTTGVEPLADLVDGLNDRLGAGTYDYVVAGSDSAVGGDAIKVGLIYKPGSVSPLGDVAILDTPQFLDPNNTGSPKNRAAVASTFVENATGEVFSVVVNHLKSKGSGCGAGDDGTLTGSCNLTRALAAGILADWIETDPTGIADDDWLIVGDLNSYDKEDPIDVLVGAGYTDLIAQYQGEFAYSFVFDGQFGYLDYVMSSSSLTTQVTGATEWHINADEPDVLDYDTSFKSDYQDTLFDPTSPFRASDHDAALVGLSLDSLDPTITATPDRIFPPNHKMRRVLVEGTDPVVGDLAIEILGVTSSDPDSGAGGSDVPNDIDVVADDEVDLRAERFSVDGRTYTITVLAGGGGQVVLDTVDVIVPHDQRRS